MTVTATTNSAIARARAIIRLNTAYFQAKVLQSAVDLGVFDLLAAGPATVDQIREKLGIKHRLTKEFLDALVGLDLLECDGKHYRNGASAAEFLVAGSATYLGGTCSQHAKLHYHAWGRLAEAMRDGKAKSAVANDGPTAYPTYYADLDRARHVMTHMDAHNGFTADELVQHIDWSGYTSFVDIGGARGNVAARIVRAHPHLRGGAFDLPALRPLFDELMQRLGTAKQVSFYGGDFFVDAMPESDVLILGHVLADWPPVQRRELLRRAYQAISPGGRVVIYDAMIDEAQGDLESLLQRMNSAMIRDHNSAYTVAECEEYLRGAGFEIDRALRADTITRDHFVIGVKSR